jgi:chaperonin GroEL
MEEGIVPGGGVAILRASQDVTNNVKFKKEHSLGASIITKAVQVPLENILDNAGLPSQVIINNILSEKDDYGFNAKTEKYENLLKSGIIDPAKVVRVSLENAASVAGMLLTTECVLNEIEDKEGLKS